MNILIDNIFLSALADWVEPCLINISKDRRWGKYPKVNPRLAGKDSLIMINVSMNNKINSHTGELVGAQARFEIDPPHRILVVDDDEDLRRLNIDILTFSGYQVDDAEDGAAAWDNLQRNSYDLLITDNNMPKVSGFELLKKLHAVRMALPVIMASGTLPAAEFKLSPWLQPTATLLKPFTGDELLGTVSRVLLTADSLREENEPRYNPLSGDLQL